LAQFLLTIKSANTPKLAKTIQRVREVLGSSLIDPDIHMNQENIRRPITFATEYPLSLMFGKVKNKNGNIMRPTNSTVKNQ
jgi:hypothetical protein